MTRVLVALFTFLAALAVAPATAAANATVTVNGTELDVESTVAGEANTISVTVNQNDTITVREHNAALDLVAGADCAHSGDEQGVVVCADNGITLADVKLPEKIGKDEGSVGWVRIAGKGRKGRFVTLNHKAAKAIKRYLAVRPKLDDPHLFLTKFGKGMGPRAIEQMVTKYLAQAGIGGATVHTLRHTFATQHVKRGTKLDVVRQALGHESLATTSLYVELARDVMDRELQQNAL
jgi:site-specific recombinase XerC